MHWFDVATGIALLFGGVWSFFRGLVREVLSVLGITAAFILSFQGYPYVTPYLETMLPHPWLRQATGFALIFLTTVVLYVAIATLLHRLIKVAGLSLPNRFLGGLFGLLKVTVMVSALCLITGQFFPAAAAQLAAESLLAPGFFRVADALSTLLPPGAAAQFRGVSERIRQQLPTWGPVLPAALPGSAAPSTGSPTPGQEDISESDARAMEKLIRQRLEKP